MAIRNKSVRLSVTNAQTKKYINNASIKGQQLELGIPTKELDGFDAILLDYEQYAITIQNEDYAAMDAALDIVIVN